ncbi:MAG: hypothetical protein C4326_00385 [Ignavibacteria bacterium]
MKQCGYTATSHFQISKREELGALFNRLGLLGNGAEIGVQAGAFSAVQRRSWQGKRLHLIGRWRHAEDYHDIANVSQPQQDRLYRSVIEKFSGDRIVTIYRLDSVEAASQFPDNFFDWIYLDADHSYNECTADLHAWYPKLRAGGVFAGHAFVDGVVEAGEFGVKSGVEEFIKPLHIELFFTQESEWKSWYFVKPDHQGCAFVTLAAGEFFQRTFDRYFRESLEQYAERVGVPRYIFREPWDRTPSALRRSLAWQKLLIFELPDLARFDRLCWLDADIMTTRSSENIFECVAGNQWGAVSELRNFTSPDELGRVYESRGVPVLSDMINTGVLVVHRQTHAHAMHALYGEAMERRGQPEQRDGGWFEQPYLSHVLMSEFTGTVLPVRFNRLVVRHLLRLPRPQDVYTMLSRSSVFLHWPGRPAEKFSEDELESVMSIVQSTEVERVSIPAKTSSLHALQTTTSTLRGHTMSHARITFAILTHNALEYTKRCLQSIERTTPAPYRIVVVDNASTDGTPQWLAECGIENLHYVLIEKNLGVPGGRNRLICEIMPSLEPSEFVLFLDNDVELLDGWYLPFLHLFQKEPTVGIAGVVGHSIIVGKDRRDLLPAPTQQAEEVDLVSGFFMLMRSDAIRAVGFFDETLGRFWHEDDDYCIRAKGAGFRVFAVPTKAVFHHAHKSGVALPSIAKGGSPENQKYLAKKWRCLGLVNAHGKIVQRRGVAAKRAKQVIIGVDARTFQYQESVSRGIGHYSFSHLLHVARLRPDWQFVLYRESDNIPSSMEPLLALPNVTTKSVDEYTSNAIDLFHVCDPLNALFGFDSPFRLFPAERMTVTFYDLTPLRLYFPVMPESFQTAYRQRLRQLQQSGATLLAISQYTRDDLIREGIVPADRVEVVMAGLNQSVGPKSFPSDSVRELKSRLSISKPFFLHVGALDPHKNFETTLKAFVTCSKRMPCQLVVVGRLEHHLKAYADQVKSKKIKNVIFTGFLSREELEVLYAEARGLLFMSLYEGFGFPVLEAMARGCPVIASNCTSIPEVAGDAAILLPPTAVEEIAQAMHRLLTGSSLREECRAKGVERAQLFTWDATAERTLRVWERLLEIPHTVSPTHSAESEGRKSGDERQSSSNSHIQPQCHTLSLQDQSDAAKEPRESNNDAEALPPLVWEGPIFSHGSLAHVNRNIARQLAKQGVPLSICVKRETGGNLSSDIRFAAIRSLVNKNVDGQAIHIRHQWPPDLSPPTSGYLVMIQPWEFVSLPKEWIRFVCTHVDEVWTYTQYVRNVYIASGVSPERVHVVPLGVDPFVYHPDGGIFPLRTKKTFRFLFVGGTIYRKGIDLLLDAYVAAFDRDDDVCLVVKDFGGTSFYKGQTMQEKIRSIQRDRRAPEVEYIDHVLTEDEMAALYRTCNVLVQPYRGEGFGLPILEAMACGVPAIVTKGGACLDFCHGENSVLLPAVMKRLPEKKVGEFETLDFPWIFEVEGEVLKSALRDAYDHPEALKAKGERAQREVRERWTWEHTAACVRQRVASLVKKPTFRTSTALAVEQLEVSVRVAGRLYAEGRYEVALFLSTIAQELIASRLPSEDQPRLQAEVENFRGDCFFRINAFDDAKQCYEAALQANPTSSHACAGIADVLFVCGFDTQAKTLYEWAVKYDPQNKRAVQGLAKVNAELHLPPDDNSLLMDGSIQSSLEYLQVKALEELQAGDLQAAIQTADAIESLLASSPPPEQVQELRAATLNLKGTCYLRLSEISNAKRCFEAALQANPRSSAACAGLGEVFWALGTVEHAKTMFERALKNDPHNESAHTGLRKANDALGLPPDHRTLSVAEDSNLVHDEDGNESNSSQTVTVNASQ